MIIGIAGAGRMGGIHLEKVLEHPKVQEVLIYDKLPEKAERLARWSHKARAVSSLTELSQCDGVIVCVPPHALYPVACELTENGAVCLLLEKPGATSSFLLENILSKAELVGVDNTLLAGYGPYWVKDFMRKGEEILASVVWESRKPPWSLTNPLELLLNLGYHPLTLLIEKRKIKEVAGHVIGVFDSKTRYSAKIRAKIGFSGLTIKLALDLSYHLNRSESGVGTREMLLDNGRLTLKLTYAGIKERVTLREKSESIPSVVRTYRVDKIGEIDNTFLSYAEKEASTDELPFMLSPYAAWKVLKIIEKVLGLKNT